MALLSLFYPQPVVAGTTAGTYAEGNHTHELDELEATSIPVGKVLTSIGSNVASWEDPAATGDVEEAPEDGIIYGRKDAGWIDITEPANLQVRRGTQAEVNAITPLVGEPVWETDIKKLVVGDGATVGGFPVSRFPLDGTLRNTSSPSAPVAGSIFIAEEVDNRGGAGIGRPYIAGDARGSGAVDLQTQRAVATQVASGAFSFIAGSSNSTASGVRSAIINSSSSVASGSGSLVVSGESTSTASGISSISVRSAVSSDYAVGIFGVADRRNMVAHGSVGVLTGFSSTERAQAVQFILKGRTTNSSLTQLVINTSPSATYLTIPSNVALFGQIEICAIEETNATEAAHFIRKFAIQNLGGSTSLIGSVTTIGTDYESDSGYDVSITADDASGYLKIEVTGDVSKTLRWMAVVRGTEMDIS